MTRLKYLRQKGRDRFGRKRYVIEWWDDKKGCHKSIALPEIERLYELVILDRMNKNKTVPKF